MNFLNTITKIYFLSSILSILIILFFPYIFDYLIYPSEKKTDNKT